LIIVTLAGLTTAPEGSLTLPVIEPVSTWAWRELTLRIAPTAKAKKPRNMQETDCRFMNSPLSFEGLRPGKHCHLPG
jgi:hypothetical protein